MLHHHNDNHVILDRLGNMLGTDRVNLWFGCTLLA